MSHTITMNKLPPELIMAVLEQLESTIDLKSMRLCCRDLTIYASDSLFSEISVCMTDLSFARLDAISRHPRLRHIVRRIVFHPCSLIRQYTCGGFYIRDASPTVHKFPDYDAWIYLSGMPVRLPPTKLEAQYWHCLSLFEEQEAMLLTGHARLTDSISNLPNFSSLACYFDTPDLVNTRYLLEHGYCRELLKNIPLQGLTLRNSRYDLMPLATLDDIFGSHTWHTLQKLCLTNFVVGQRDLTSILQRHRLRHLSMKFISLSSGSWYEVLRSLIGGTLEEVHLDCLYLFSLLKLHPPVPRLSPALNKAELWGVGDFDRLIMDFLKFSSWSPRLPESLLHQAGAQHYLVSL